MFAHSSFASCKCRDNDYSTPLELLDDDEEEILDLLDEDHLLPRNDNPELEEDIIEVFLLIGSCAHTCQSINQSVSQFNVK